MLCIKSHKIYSSLLFRPFPNYRNFNIWFNINRWINIIQKITLAANIVFIIGIRSEFVYSRRLNVRVLLSLVLAQPYNLLCKRTHRLNLGKTRNGELEEKKDALCKKQFVDNC